MSTQRMYTYSLEFEGNINEVFPLFCPVVSKSWWSDRQDKGIKQHTGAVGKNCIFSTQWPAQNETFWYVTQHSPGMFTIELIGFAKEFALRINVQFYPIDMHSTSADITCLFIQLGRMTESYKQSLESSFDGIIKELESAVNAYLKGSGNYGDSLS